MNIILLKGPGNTGKTATLGIVYEALIGESTIVEERKQVGGDAKDFSCVLKYTGKNIALYSMGDYTNVIKRIVRGYSSKQYDILICAINNDKYSGCNVENTISKHNPTIVDKTIAKENFDSANKQDATRILEVLQNSI